MRITQTLWAAGCLAAALLASRPQDTDTSIQDFAARAAATVASRNWEAIRKLGATPETLAWLSHKAKQGDDNWRFHLVTLPTSQQTTDPTTQRPNDPTTRYLAVFSAHHSCQSIGDHFHHMTKTPDGWRVGPEISENDTLGYRVRDHRLTVRFNLPAKSAYLTDDVTVEQTGAAPGSVCFLRLSANMQVDSVRQNGAPVPFTFVPGLIVLTPQEKTSVFSLTYHGAFDQPGMDTYVNEREVFLSAYWYPHIGRLPAKSAVTVTVPKGWTAVGQGVLLGKTEKENETIFSFRNEIPVSYFSLDAGAYLATTRTAGGIDLAAYQLQENPKEAERALKELEKALTFFSKTFCKYPYPKYSLVQTLGPFGGALEAYSFSTYQGRAFGEVTHEVAHTWWGGIIPCTYTHSMWNESFAVYSEGMLNRQTAAVRPAHAMSRAHMDQNFGRDLIRGYAVPAAIAFDTENSAHASVGYGKGAQVLAMLEDEIGTAKMIEAMRKFIADHKEGEAGDWPEFETAVNAVVGHDMRWFFDQWIDRGGVPVVRLESVRRARSGAGWTVAGEAVQEGKPYRLNIPVRIECSSGASITKNVTISGSSQPFSFLAPAEPVAVTLDPDGTVLMAGAKTARAGESPFHVSLR